MNKFKWLFWGGGSFELASSSPYRSLNWDAIPRVDGRGLVRLVNLQFEAACEDLQLNILNLDTEIVSLDLEINGWTHNPDICDIGKDSQITKYMSLVSCVRDRASAAKIGAFGVFPQGGLGWLDSFNVHARTARRFLATQRSCATDHCEFLDYLSPVLYSPYNEENEDWGSAEAWLTTIRTIIRDARLACPTKEVIPFVWRMAAFGDNKGTLNPSYWSQLLNAITILADGAFVFAYSVEEDSIQAGSTSEITTQNWFRILEKYMDFSLYGSPSARPPSRKRHERKCACVDAEVLIVSFPLGLGEYERSFQIMQSASDECLYGVGQPGTSERAFVLEPFYFSAHSLEDSESFIEIKMECASREFTATVVLNSNLVGFYVGGLGTLVSGNGLVDRVSGSSPGACIKIDLSFTSRK